jgi:hypothetical protein
LASEKLEHRLRIMLLSYRDREMELESKAVSADSHKIALNWGRARLQRKIVHSRRRIPVIDAERVEKLNQLLTLYSNASKIPKVRPPKAEPTAGGLTLDPCWWRQMVINGFTYPSVVDWAAQRLRSLGSQKDLMKQSPKIKANLLKTAGVSTRGRRSSVGTITNDEDRLLKSGAGVFFIQAMLPGR